MLSLITSSPRRATSEIDVKIGELSFEGRSLCTREFGKPNCYYFWIEMRVHPQFLMTMRKGYHEPSSTHPIGIAMLLPFVSQDLWQSNGGGVTKKFLIQWETLIPALSQTTCKPLSRNPSLPQCGSEFGGNLGALLGGSQTSQDLLEMPWPSPNFPELPQKFPGDFPEKNLSLWIQGQYIGYAEVRQTTPDLPTSNRAS